MSTNHMKFFLAVILMSVCVSPALAETTQTAVMVTAAADWSSGSHSIVSVDPVGGPRQAQNNLNPAGSDLTVKAHENYSFRMERSGAHHIAKYDVNTPDVPIWQFSTEGGESDSNPYDLVFSSDEKAYLMRYGSESAWIVNPEANAETEFKIGELDLSGYTDADGTPEMVAAIIVDDLLFVALQRIDTSGGWGNYTYNIPYVAVIDTKTDTEIDVYNCSCDLKGIPVDGIFNLLTIQYLEDTGMIYVQGVGNWDDSDLSASGGIVRIDPTTYETEVILSDGPDFGAISGMAVVSETKGYFVGYAGWGNNSLYAFDPSCGCDVTEVTGFENISISGMQSGVYTDKNDMLWICNQTTASVDILNTATDTIDESVSTGMNPNKVVFCSEGSPDDNRSDFGNSEDTCFISTLK
jgi:hypothetical protein